MAWPWSSLSEGGVKHSLTVHMSNGSCVLGRSLVDKCLGIAAQPVAPLDSLILIGDTFVHFIRDDADR